MSNRNDKKQPKPEVLEAFKAIEELSSEFSEKKINALKKTLPHLAAKMAYSGAEVTKDILIEHAHQGEDHIADMIQRYSKPKQTKILSYKDVIDNLEYPQQQLDQNLTLAIKDINIKDVLKWLKRGAKTETKTSSANPLNVAISVGDINILKLVLDYTDIKNAEVNRGFDVALRFNNTAEKKAEIINLLFEYKYPINQDLFNQHDMFGHLCEISDLKLIQKFYDCGALSNTKVDNDNIHLVHPIMSALLRKNLVVAKFLLDNGADISCVYDDRERNSWERFDDDTLKFIIQADPDLAARNAAKFLKNPLSHHDFDKCDFFIEECSLSLDYAEAELKAQYFNAKAWQKMSLDPMDFINKNHLYHRPISKKKYEKIVRKIKETRPREHYIGYNPNPFQRVETSHLYRQMLHPQHQAYLETHNRHDEIDTEIDHEELERQRKANYKKHNRWLEIGRKLAGQGFHSDQSWEDHQKKMQRELDDVVKNTPLRRLYRYSPHHVDMDTLLAISDILEEEGYSKSRDGLLYAYHAAAVFKTEQRVLEYLQKWGKAGKQPLHNIIHEISVPEAGRPDLKSWGDALMKHGPKMAKFIKFSDRLIQPIKDGSGGWSYKRTEEEIAQYSFKRGPENPELAKYCLDVSWNDQLFDKALAQIDVFNKKYYPSGLPEVANDNIKGGAIPDITIKGSKFDKEGYTFRKLPDGDVRGLLLGKFTNCCQHLGSRDGCTKNGFHSETAGFYVVEDNKSGGIIAQTWAWRGQNGELTFDSWESLSGHFNKKSFTKLCNVFSEHVKDVAESLEITAFTVGTGGETPYIDFECTDNPAKPKDNKYLNKSENQYEADSRNQYLIAEYS